ncbi:SUN3_2 [Blepharisma stoltei]|uniref:SUN domain-containing protein n=1 Tax=Blepharisma stoltei TaxID=1481888 RepID=A0AAU9J9X9_9CILI|nr:unnamed protein product [Blepharisma stoltei]
MESVGKTQLGKLPASLTPSPSLSCISLSPQKSLTSVEYRDLKNKWAPTAVKSDKMDFTTCFCISLFIFLLGSLFSMVFVHFWITDHTSQILPIKEVLQPVVIKETQEESLDAYINYASITNKATVIKEHSSPEFHASLAWLSNNQRESALSDDNSFGKCWAFEGEKGQLAIQLGYEIYPEQFFIKHINIVDYATAPKNFSVWSMETAVEDNECSLLGSYSFDMTIKGEKRRSWEIFKCANNCDTAITAVLLEIESNYGANDTCVYQFGLHGRPK